MAFLLDTHTLIWWWLGDASLSRRAKSVLTDRGGPIFVSAVSAIEIGIKVRSGKLPTMIEPLVEFDDAVTRDGFAHLNVTYAHAREAGLTPGAHGDPFGRFIAAQSRLENLVVITRDPAFAAFGCETLW